MDSTKRKEHPNPREGASLPSVLVYAWLAPLFHLGWKKTIGVEDLYDPLKRDRSEVLGDKLSVNWERELAKWKKNPDQRPSLLRSLVRSFIWDYSKLACFVLMSSTASITQCLFLGAVLGHFRPGSTTSRSEAINYAVGLVLCTFIEILGRNKYDLTAFHSGLRMRAACCSLIYRKSLRLSRRALGDMASGQVVNLLSNDVSRFDLMSIFLHYMWMGPLQTFVIVYLIWRDGGFPAMFGLAVLFFVVILQSYIGKLSSKFRRLIAFRTDERIRLVNEVIQGIQVIKMYAWEKPFIKLMGYARRKELHELRKTSIVRGIYMTFHLCTCRLALFCSLVGLSAFGIPISADKVFVFYSYYGILSFSLGGMFVRGCAEISEGLVSIERLQKYLMYEEFRAEAQLKPNSTSGDKSVSNNIGNSVISSADQETESSDILRSVNDVSKSSDDGVNRSAVTLTDVLARWSDKSSEPTLDKVNLKIACAQLLAIIGPVGSGKSSVLQVILGELPLSEGSVKVQGKISYASQDPWLFASTVRQNILFGSQFDRRRYDKVIRACALQKDFEQFPQGDLTVVGERGVSLSGGQRARINLARAVYREADIYLLDDPLSAVDTHVGRHLFEQCICRCLRNKTVILVTHQLQYLKGADRIIIMTGGTTVGEGTFDELVHNSSEYAKLLKEIEAPEAHEGDKVSHKNFADALDVNNAVQVQLSRKSGLIFEGRSSRCSSYTSSLQSIQDNDETNEEPEASSPLVDPMEATSKGVVKGSVYLLYFKANGSLVLFVFVIMFFIIAQICASGLDYWVSFWVKQEEKIIKLEKLLLERNASSVVLESAENSTAVQDFIAHDVMFDEETIVYIYSAIVVAILLFSILRSGIYYVMALRISQRLHDLMFSSVINTAMRFFDTNPSGRILNRFSKDMGSVDEILPKIILDTSQILLNLAGSLALSLMINYMLLIPVVIMFFIFRFVQRVYLKTSKDLKRLEGMVRSPVFSHLNVTLQGMATIRAFGAEEILRSEFDTHQDLHSSAWFLSIAGSSAFALVLDLLSVTYNVSVVTSLFLTNQEYSSGEVGLAITQSMAITSVLHWGIRQLTEVANNMMSAERILEYCQLPPEKSVSNSGTKPSDDWPQKGSIDLINVYLRYSPLESPVLQNINLHIRPAEKVGIVGRTGAGKSSLIATLFRMAIVEGQVKIDDIDTGSLSLEQLRSAISIIPQDPVLFSGTMRYNLDPFNEYKDDQLWSALEEVELKDVLTEQQGLDTRVSERGANFSVGQRQLVCLARAILRANRVLMLDEATANVDPQTDALIQNTIREKFKACTVLTVAHRLNTVIDSDRVLVMDNGTVAEFDHAYKLLECPDSLFLKMVKKTGSHAAEHLCQAAKQAFHSVK